MGFIVKLVVSFIIAGIILSQAGPILWNYVTCRTAAGDIAKLGADAYMEAKGGVQASEAAKKVIEEEARSRNVKIVGEIKILPDESGRLSFIEVEVKKIEQTYLFSRIGFLNGFQEAHATGKADLRM